jgi:predicted RNA-binding protein with PIN domain
MGLLIDGYNLLNVTDLFGVAAGTETALHASRRVLLNFLARSLDAKTRAETTIVFDAAGAPPGLPAILNHEQMTVRFARRHSNADELLEQLIEEHAAPQTLLVVSSDHRVQRAARQRRAAYIDSDKWYNETRDAGKPAAPNADAAAKPDRPPSAEDVAYWVERFGKKD